MAMTIQTRKVEKINIIKLGRIFFEDLIFFFFKDNANKVRPKTKLIFATLEPITFPITIVNLPSKAAKKLVSSSGAEVPNAITVEPIKKGETPNLVAEATEYFSSCCALYPTRITPDKI